MLDEWEMLYLGTGIVMCRRITTDRMSDSSGVHGGHGGLGTGEQVQVHANVPGGRRNITHPRVVVPHAGTRAGIARCYTSMADCVGATTVLVASDKGHLQQAGG